MALKIIAAVLLGIACLALVLRVFVDVRDSLRDLRVISGHTHYEDRTRGLDFLAAVIVAVVGLGFAVL